jgi:hypothetical protein
LRAFWIVVMASSRTFQSSATSAGAFLASEWNFSKALSILAGSLPEPI